MDRKKRSIFNKVILVNTIVSFVFVCTYLFSFLYFNYKAKQETQNYSNQILSSMTQNFEVEMNRLTTFSQMCINDPSFIMTVSNKIPPNTFSQYATESLQKLSMISYSLPYAESVFLYNKNGNIYYFTNMIISRKQTDIINNSSGVQVGIPNDMIQFDFNELSTGFYPINQDYSVYVANILDVGSLVIKLNAAKFCNLEGISTVLPSYSAAMLDGHNRIFAVSSPHVNDLLKNIDLHNIYSGDIEIKNVKFKILQRVTNNGFRFLLIAQTTALQKLQTQNNMIDITISIAIFIVCMILILINTIIYNPLRKMAHKYSNIGGTRNEIDIINGKVTQLIAENTQMQEQIRLQRTTQVDIELNFAVNAKGGITQQLSKQLKDLYGQYRMVVAIIQDQHGNGEDHLLALDDYFLEVFQCKIIVIDQFFHTYMVSDIHKISDIVSKIEVYFKGINPSCIAFAGISDYSDDFSQINKIYSQAYERMMKNLIPLHKQYSISAFNGNELQDNPVVVSFEIQDTIAKCVLNGTRKDIESILHHVLFSDDDLTLKNIIGIYKQLSSLLLVLQTPASGSLAYSELNISKKTPVYNPAYMYQSLVDDYARLNNYHSQEHSPLRYGIIDYLQKHYSEPLSLDSISAVFGITPVYLSTWFKKNTGTNISIYLSNIRMEEAKRIVSEDKNIKIADVAAKVGILSVSAFIRQFKNYTGTTPDQYRQRR